MADYNKILTRLHSDFTLVENLGYTCLGVFLQGSQNYELDYAGSDIDTKAIVIPSMKDVILNRSPVSTTHILESNEHIDIKDIRLMFDCFKKQNINFIEILFTKYKLLNPRYEKLFTLILLANEAIAHYNNYASVNCIAGMVFEKRKALTHPYPTLKDKIDKYGYDNKQLHHIIRCEEFLRRYIDGTPYAGCLIPPDVSKEHLIRVKSSYIMSCEQACELADELEQKVKTIKQNYMDTHDCVVNKAAEELLADVSYKIIRRKFMDDIGYDADINE